MNNSPKSENCHNFLTKFQTCINAFVLPNTKEDILKKVCKSLFWGTIDFHSRKKKYSHILQNNSLCVQQKKDIHTGLERHDGD